MRVDFESLYIMAEEYKTATVFLDGEEEYFDVDESHGMLGGLGNPNSFW